MAATKTRFSVYCRSMEEQIAHNEKREPRKHAKWSCCRRICAVMRYKRKKIRLVFKCTKFLYVKRAQAQPLPPHANKISSDRPNADAELRRGVWAARRPLSWCFGVIAATPDRLNKTNMSGFSYLSADSGLVSSAAVAHRARTASRRSAGAGRSGALWSGDDCMSWNATCLRAAASSPFAFI